MPSSQPFLRNLISTTGGSELKNMSLRDPEYYVAVTTIQDGAENAKWKTAYMKPGGGTERYVGCA